MNINTDITENDQIPMALWGRDHWSTLAYVETQLVEGGYRISFDPKMRQKRRNFRVLAQNASRSEVGRGVVMQPEHGSRLANNTYLPWHDDWDCVMDMIQEGLFVNDGAIDAGYPLILTEKGHAAVAALRKHKATGGSFTDCFPAIEAGIGAFA